MRKTWLSLSIAASMVIAAPASFAAEGAAHTGGLEGYKVGVQAEGLDKLEHVKQVLVPPPAVPEHSLEHPAKPRVVQVEMTIHEKESEVEPGVFMWAHPEKRQQKPAHPQH